MLTARDAAGQVMSAPAASSPAAETRRLQDDFKIADRHVQERTAAIQRGLADVQKLRERIQSDAATSGARLTPEQEATLSGLERRRSLLQDQLTFLQALLSARQSAIEAQETNAQLEIELQALHKRTELGPLHYTPAEIESLKAELAVARSILETVNRGGAARQERLSVVEELLKNEDGAPERAVLQAERNAIYAQADSARQSREAWELRIKLLEARIAASSPTTAAALTQPATTSGPAVDQREAENRQRFAETLERMASGERLEARRRLNEVRAQMQAALEKGDLSELPALEDDREYWGEHKLNYESRRVIQANVEKRNAYERRQIAQIEADLESARKLIEQVKHTGKKYSREEREDLAARYRAQAEEARSRAAETARRASAGQPDAALWANLLKSFDAKQRALDERVKRQFNLRFYNHYWRMVRQLDLERQQINSLQNSLEVVTFAQQRQVTLLNRLGDAYVQIADILVPPQPTFWERNRSIINSIWIMLIAAAAGYVLKFMIWLIQRGAAWLSFRMPGRVSVKRAETLLSFFGSIIRFFIWIFAVILVLSEFKIDPARSTAYIGILTIVMAGMFQQVIIDFIKGFDIVTGRHYNVGDYVELDGKTGHVIDFSVKHTRLRTASGQEYNLPNSKCIPSRRFPDGYVDNYVDIAVKSTADIQRARRAINPVCRHLGRRVEQVKEEPIFADQFPGTRPSSVILRYRVRILPACEWVITRQFIPDIEAALAAEGIELAEKPTFFFINRIHVFRQLFSRELSEKEILQEAKDQQRPTVERAEHENDGDGASTDHGKSLAGVSG